MDENILQIQCRDIAQCVTSLGLILLKADNEGVILKVVSQVHKLLESFKLLGKYYVGELLQKCKELEAKKQEVNALLRKLQQAENGHTTAQNRDFSFTDSAAVAAQNCDFTCFQDFHSECRKRKLNEQHAWDNVLHKQLRDPTKSSGIFPKDFQTNVGLLTGAELFAKQQAQYQITSGMARGEKLSQQQPLGAIGFWLEATLGISVSVMEDAICGCLHEKKEVWASVLTQSTDGVLEVSTYIDSRVTPADWMACVRFCFAASCGKVRAMVQNQIVIISLSDTREKRERRAWIFREIVYAQTFDLAKSFAIRGLQEEGLSGATFCDTKSIIETLPGEANIAQG